MNHARRLTSLLAVMTALILIVAAAAGWAAITVHQWEDYTKPFKTRLKGVSGENPGIVQLTLPASVIENKQVMLSVSSSSFGNWAASYRAVLYVNDQQLPPFMVGPGLNIPLERGILKPGINTLRFYGSASTVKIDVYELKIELTEPPPSQAQTAPLPLPKPQEAKKPPEPERAKLAEKPVVTPTPPKQEDDPAARNSANTPQKRDARLGRSETGRYQTVRCA